MTDQTEDTETEPMRAFTRSVFGTETEDPAETTETDDEHKPPVGNFVPNEGNVPENKDNTDAQFVRDLFGY